MFHRLSKGATICGFPASALRSEARKGRLEIVRIANKDYVTDEAIDEMIKRCSERRDRVSGSKSARDVYQSGPSAMEKRSEALAYLSSNLKKPSDNSRIT
jgi:hypothetical protein